MEVSNISSVLNRLHIDYKESSTSMIDLICPFHSDENYGSCKINAHTGLGFCFACQEGFDAIKLVRHINKCSFKEALSFLNISTDNIYKSSILDMRYDTPTNKDKSNILTYQDYAQLSLTDINPEDYPYTKNRGMTYSFFRKFNVKLCDKGYYKNYLIFPIVDTVNKVMSYECRKIMEYEYLKAFFKIDKDAISIKRLKNTFKTYVKSNNIQLKRNSILFINGEEVFDDILTYLLLPKTLYPKGSLLGKPTIWNFENLDKDKPLYVCEGLATIPRLYSELDTNVTATFGVNITEKQWELLNQFKKIIIIKDDDEAGDSFVNQFKNNCMAEVLVANTKLKDTDDLFIEEIKNKPLLYTVDKL